MMEEPRSKRKERDAWIENERGDRDKEKEEEGEEGGEEAREKVG